jgi:hypothetical protein
VSRAIRPQLALTLLGWKRRFEPNSQTLASRATMSDSYPDCADNMLSCDDAISPKTSWWLAYKTQAVRIHTVFFKGVVRPICRGR